MTDPTLIAQIGDALDRADDLVLLQAAVDEAFLGHWDRTVADIATRPYESGMLQALAWDRLTDTRPPLPTRLPGLTLAASGNWRCPDCDTWNGPDDRVCHCCGN